MLTEDVTTYLVATTSLGLTIRTTSGGNLYRRALPESAPNLAVAVMEYAAGQPAHAMGASLSAPLYEDVRFQVLVRVAPDDYSTGRAMIEDIYRNLDWLMGSTEIGTTGSTRYLSVRALTSPYWMGQDTAGRHRFTANFEARKERG
jgi:hypothetical protein